MISAFFIVLREVIEAAIIISILSTVLIKTKKYEGILGLRIGTAAGIITSIIFAILFKLFLGGLTGRVEEIFEGALMIIAALMIITMIIWMKNQAKNLESNFEKQIHNTEKLFTTVLFTAFFAVLREGVETVIFLEALASQSGNTSLAYGGAVIGFAVAIIISIGIYIGFLRIPKKAFFTISSLLLILISGGLLAHGIVELQGAEIIPTIIKPLWDNSNLLPENEGIGLALKTLFGYDDQPSLLSTTVYFLYIIGATYFWSKNAKPKSALTNT